MDMNKIIENIIRKVLGEFTAGGDLVGTIVAAVKKLAADSDFIKTAVTALRAAGVDIPVHPVKDAEEEPVAADPTEPAAEAAAAAPKLSWCYGGFKGGKAKESAEAVLAGASLKANTLSFSWTKGGCEQLGATSRTDADHTLACLFLANGKGGKFEWVSTSRKTRSAFRRSTHIMWKRRRSPLNWRCRRWRISEGGSNARCKAIRILWPKRAV